MAFDRFFKMGLLVLLAGLALVLGLRMMDRVDAQPTGNAMIGRYQFVEHSSAYETRWYIIDTSTGQIFEVDALVPSYAEHKGTAKALTAPMK